VLPHHHCLHRRSIAAPSGWPPGATDGAADIEPTSTFTLGKAKLNKKKGTATLAATVPNPGELIGSGKGGQSRQGRRGRDQQDRQRAGEPNTLKKRVGLRSHNRNTLGTEMKVIEGPNYGGVNASGRS
jgi:hypothetical protein